MLTTTHILSSIAAATADTGGGFNIPSFFTTNFESIGGFSLFIGLCLFIVVGSFMEWWVPGKRYRKLEESSAKQAEQLSVTVNLLKDQTLANEITKDFFLKVGKAREGGDSQ